MGVPSVVPLWISESVTATWLTRRRCGFLRTARTKRPIAIPHPRSDATTGTRAEGANLERSERSDALGPGSRGFEAVRSGAIDVLRAIRTVAGLLGAPRRPR